MSGNTRVILGLFLTERGNDKLNKLYSDILQEDWDGYKHEVDNLIERYEDVFIPTKPATPSLPPINVKVKVEAKGKIY